MTEETLYRVLLSVAESRFEPKDWAAWWSARTRPIQKLLTPGEFRRLNITPDSERSYAWMLSCQQEAEAILNDRQIPFRHGTQYEIFAARERSGRQERPG